MTNTARVRRIAKPIQVRKKRPNETYLPKTHMYTISNAVFQ
jgi:hypothetical protein